MDIEEAVTDFLVEPMRDPIAEIEDAVEGIEKTVVSRRQ